MLYEALGKEEAYKVTDFEGLTWRYVGIPKGEPSVLATCAGFGPVNKSLRSKNKQKFEHHLQAIYNFCFYNRKRIDEFRDMAKKVIEVCNAETKNSKLKMFSQRMIETAKRSEELWEEVNVELFRPGLKKHAAIWGGIVNADEIDKTYLDEAFFKKVKAYFEKAFKENLKVSRSHWVHPGGILDGIISEERRVAARIRQEAALVGIHSPEERELALKIRDLAQKALRHYHLKELWWRGRVHYEKKPRLP